MPDACPYSPEELKDKLDECIRTYDTVNRQFGEAREKKELQHQDLAEVIQKHENILKKIDDKTHEREGFTEKINEEQAEQQQLQQQQMPRLTKKYTQLNEDIRKCQEQLSNLIKIPLKVRS